MSQKAISTLKELTAWLTEQKIDFSRWGKGSTKSIHDLFHEILKGDTQICSNPARRKVEVAVIVIRAGSKFLIEKEQVFSDARTRTRNWPPSEKLHQNESVPNAARRCLEEELGVAHTQIKAITVKSGPSIECKPSPSYPGLETEYRLHVVEANVTGLPKRPFETHEIPHNALDPVARHRWDWGDLPVHLQTIVF